MVQFLTSRGIAVAAVDYRGSTGYGRAYRDALRGGWGEADVDDCVAYARSLADAGLVDGGRMAIRGTSAGGLTALAALVRARCFAGAVAWYGVTDLVALAADTHDFESRYLDGLVGPLPEARRHLPGPVAAPPRRRPGGPGAAAPGLRRPDRAARPGRAVRRRAAGRRGRLRAAWSSTGESHGFRPGRTIEAALDAELGFYRALFAPGGRPWLSRPAGGLVADGGRRGSGPRRPTERDALLYGCSAVFAGVTAVAMSIPLYRQWGQLAVGPYAVGTVWMVVVCPDGGPPRHRARPRARVNGRAGRRPGWPPSLIVLLGATVVPLALEVVWASRGQRRRSTSSPRSWWWSGPASGPPTARTRTRWSTATATS